MPSAPAIHDITQRNVELIAQLEAEAERGRSFGERVADIAATCVGSWLFLIAQSVLLVLWMAVNASRWWLEWDPYPFVLLNLLMSFEAAFAMPILLMSQNRQNRIIERRSHLDLQVNLLAEQENTEQLRLLRMLCEKVGVKLDAPETNVLEELTRPDEIIRQIRESVEQPKPPEE
jgi:uncharacterized membrane protein